MYELKFNIFFDFFVGMFWMNWILVGSVVMGLVFLFVFLEWYICIDIDIYVDKVEIGYLEIMVIVCYIVY